MNIFKDRAIVLNIYKKEDKKFLYCLFTKKYGKIIVEKKILKKEKIIDIGYLLDLEIISQENKKIQKIKNIKIKGEFNLDKNNSFLILNFFLEILAIIYKQMPTGESFEEIFEIVEKIILKQNIDEIMIFLGKVKIKYLLGGLNIENKNKTIEKILKFTSRSRIKDIFRLKGIDAKLKEELFKYNF